MMNGKKANSEQGSHLNQIVYDAINKLENFKISEKTINGKIDMIFRKSKYVLYRLKTSNNFGLVVIFVVFVIQYFTLRKFLIKKRMV